jgi:hypothetical protein
METQERLKKELVLVQSKDKVQMQKQQERDQIRQEVHAEFQVQAQTFVAEQIALAKAQMQSEFQQQLSQQRMQNQFAPSGTASRKTFISFVPMQEVNHEVESMSEGTYLIDASGNTVLDTMQQARAQRRQNQAAGNTIRNVSNTSANRF